MDLKSENLIHISPAAAPAAEFNNLNILIVYSFKMGFRTTQPALHGFPPC